MSAVGVISIWPLPPNDALPLHALASLAGKSQIAFDIGTLRCRTFCQNISSKGRLDPVIAVAMERAIDSIKLAIPWELRLAKTRIVGDRDAAEAEKVALAVCGILPDIREGITGQIGRVKINSRQSYYVASTGNRIIYYIQHIDSRPLETERPYAGRVCRYSAATVLPPPEISAVAAADPSRCLKYPL